MDGNLLSNTMFQQYIFVLALGTILGGFIYFMDYRKISKYSVIIYAIGVLLNIISSISDDVRLEYLYASLPFYVISFAGFINVIGKKKRNIVKTVVLGIISLVLLRKVRGVPLRFVAFAYLIMSTIKILKLKKNKFKYLAIIWTIPIIITSMEACEIIYYMSINSENQWMGMINGRNELINSAELFGTVNDPRKNSNDTTPAKFIDSDYAFLSFLADYGWVASIAMTLAIILLNVKLIINAIKIKDEYGKMIIISIAALYILQTINNFNASFSIASFADVPIPFITFGITNLFANMMCMALVLSVYRRKNSNFETEKGVEAIEY